MVHFALLHRFPHWSEVLAVLKYNNSLLSSDPKADFVYYKKGETYTDPLGNTHTIYPKGSFTKDDVMIFNGSIHLETHPLSVGKIPYSSFPYKIGIEHTTGYSPWDCLQMVELAEISAKGDPEYAQGSKVLYLMNKKFYDRFMRVDWTTYGKQYYEDWKPRINRLVDRGFIVPTLIEPAQFWLENVDVNRKVEKSDHMCICLNWCNLNKVVKIKKIVEICKEIHDYTGKDIDIRLHSYSREGLFHFLEELPYVHLIPYLSMSKYEVMDKYENYFVDGTGLGYEIAYRNMFKDREVNIFYLSGLPSDEEHQGFDGIVEMKAVPEYTYKDFIKGADHSNFSYEVIKESFPHTPGLVSDQCAGIIKNAADLVTYL